ncbi:hypothetical protein GCWU000341_00268 [Oribacterium sp. oral taxon 078 str. F0262]|nr:hypothetical protein GCWU000341_00268 [Oribacterium sp. oral taxon 078 str. F0262]
MHGIESRFRACRGKIQTSFVCRPHVFWHGVFRIIRREKAKWQRLN